MRVRRKHMTTIPGDRLQKAPKKRNMRAKKLALATGTAHSNISHYPGGKSHTESPDVLKKSAKKLNVSADCLLDPSDEKTPAAPKKTEDFGKNFGKPEDEDDFLMMAGVYYVPMAKAHHTDYVRSYDQCVLGKDGKTVTPIDCNPKK